ncbi:MAG: alanyl-tRNA editing protein [Candidatus Thermoplasmatota archaeon]|nr:alanyl-tRNA editing protein [Candidatus Thermoplasmatota archaeon]
MTKILYMDNIDGNYIKDFSAKVIKNKDDYIILDKTAFYPMGGGQSSDTGFIEWDNKKSEVLQVIKKGNAIKHIIKGEKPSVEIQVHATIDWDIRYKHMKMHTAQHIISGIVFDDYKARTVGNQIHADYSRVDFHPVKFSEKDLEDIVKKFNEIVSMNLPVNIYEEERISLEKRVDTQRSNLDLLPKFISKLRIVEIQGFDICPCAGTHVKNTSEIPHIKEIRRETKGKDIDRIIYSLDY